jgi:hypothetical protein
VYIPLRCGTIITGSAIDEDIWNAHRWRFINGHCVTTKHNGTYEVPIDAANVLFNVDRSVTVIRKTDNPHDYRRSSLTLTPTQRTNTWIPQGDLTYMLTTNGKTVLLDTADVSKVSGYVWSTSATNGSLSIYTRANVDGTTKRFTLYRLLLDIPHHSRTTVKYRNGDVLDLRRANLELKHYREKS